MINRELSSVAESYARQFKVVAVLGPRQSGKTTLARAVFDGKPYVSLEAPDNLLYARGDARGFLAGYPDGAVIDEAQRCPELFSYLQVLVDERREPGLFILTGSQHFGLMASISQSLAGRVGLLTLPPFSLRELKNGELLWGSSAEAIFHGGYPPIYDQPVEPVSWLNSYVATYVERDVRQVLNIQNLDAFRLFLRLCAGALGQELNVSRLAADAGIDQKTAAAWLGILECGFIVFRLPPHHRNFRKRLVKRPKLYFHDTGLACRLLGIDSPSQAAIHHMRGPLFENLIVAEFLKARLARGESPNLFFWRDNVGNEIDLLIDDGGKLRPVEIKSGATIAADWFGPVRKWLDLAGGEAVEPTLVYGGDECQTRNGIRVLPWNQAV